MFELIQKQVLVARETARQLEKFVIAAVKADPEEITLNFSGAEGIAPNFFDELLSIIDDQAPSRYFTLHLINMPTSLSKKFVYIAQTYNFIVTEKNAEWILTR